ncbi:AMP-binding protein [Thermodesulfobacteriota bacterium]
MAEREMPLYKYPDYPETYGDIVDWAVKRVEDPERKVFFRLSEGEVSVTYAAFARNINQVCNFLKDVGIKKGDHVAVFLPNCLEYAFLYHSLAKCGAVIVPIIQFLRGDALRYILEHSDSTYLITSCELFSDKILQLMPSFRKLTSVLFIDKQVDVKEARSIMFSQYKEYPHDFEPYDRVTGADVQGIWYTSGTTGPPKGVVIKHKAYIWRSIFFADYFRLGSESVIYYILPMYHSGYAVLGAPLALAGGGEIIQVLWFSASTFWEDVVKYKVTLTASTGTVIPIMLKQPLNEEEIKGKDILKLWIGWPVGDEQVVKDRWPSIKFIELYGTTEAPIASVSRFERPKLGNAGPPTIYTDLKLIDVNTGVESDKRNVPCEMAYKHKLGPDYIIQEYYKDREKSKDMIRDGYWYSGDLGMIDDDGNLHFVDRIKDYLRIGGENVSSSVVEDIIRKHPAINEVAVVGIIGELRNDEMVAHVVLNDGMVLDPKAFFEFCNENMSYFMVPRYLVLRSEIPKTGTLRVEKYKLRKEGVDGAIDRIALGIKLKR